MGRYFNKHKSFLSNGLKGKTEGKVKKAHDKFLNLSIDEVKRIGKEKFEEWEIDNFSGIPIKENFNNKWRK